MSRVSGKPYFVYVLWSGSGQRFYIGISEDPQKRLAQHNEGKTAWTARHRPWVLVYEERHEDYASARRREIRLKRQKAGRGFYKLSGIDPQQFISG